MPPTFLPNAYIDRFNRAMEYLGPLFDVAVRVWVARAFFLSGLSKIQNWDTTLTLFQFEYSVPLLPPNVAAYLGTAAELSLPVFVALGLLGRASSLALFLFNGVAVYSYASFLLSDGGAAGRCPSRYGDSPRAESRYSRILPGRGHFCASFEE